MKVFEFLNVTELFECALSSKIKNGIDRTFWTAFQVRDSLRFFLGTIAAVAAADTNMFFLECGFHRYMR